MKNRIIGRKKSIHQLKNCLNDKEASLVVVTGRRRVGKTYLVNNVFDEDFAFKVTGDYLGSKEVQLNNFVNELNRRWNRSLAVPKNWYDAFSLLRDYLESLEKNKKHIFFFDELPWLDTHSSGFLDAFEYFWNDYASAKSNLLLIVCGSSSSWIEDKIINNKGGLYKRYTQKITLLPFTLKECKEYLEYKGIHWSNYDIATIYMILGGIPYYLRLLDGSLSLGQNVDELFFTKDAALKNEFALLFRTLFSGSKQYVDIVKALANKKNGLSRDEISKKLNVANNGDLSEKIDNLCITGFVAPFDARNGRKGVRYRLSDYFSAFYLKFVDGSNGVDEHYWSKSSDNPSVIAWKGLTFENLCFDHIENIKDVLGIKGVITESFSWSHASANGRGAQIDLVIKRRDRVTNICEINTLNDLKEAFDRDYVSHFGKTILKWNK